MTPFRFGRSLLRSFGDGQTDGTRPQVPTKRMVLYVPTPVPLRLRKAAVRPAGLVQYTP